jgi:hypothetical protein
LHNGGIGGVARAAGLASAEGATLIAAAATVVGEASA